MKWGDLKSGDVLISAFGTDQRYLIVKVTPRPGVDSVWVTSMDLAEPYEDFVDTWASGASIAITKRYWTVIRDGRIVKLTA